MIKNILVPLDCSAFGEHALPAAAAIARRAGARIELVHVHSPLNATYLGGMAVWQTINDEMTEAENAYLEKTAGRLKEHFGVPVSHAVLNGSVAETLTRHAQRDSTDLIVMTTHGRGALSRFWLGSVAEWVVRKVERPILLVRPEKTPPDLAREKPAGRILVPLDGSDLSEAILADASELARLCHADLILLRVIAPAWLGDFDGNAYAPEVTARIQEEERVRARAYLEGLVGKLRGQGLSARGEIRDGFHPAGAILEFGREAGADLIARATHARRGFARFFLGSVTDKVLRGSEGPVLVRRPDETAPGPGKGKSAAPGRGEKGRPKGKGKKD